MRALAVVALAGCHALVGIDDFATADAPPQIGVTGTSISSYSTELADETAPEDLSAVEISAYVPDGAGGVVVYPGTGAADGTFAIPDVPVGPYYLRLHFGGTRADAIYYLTAHTVDLGGAFVGKPHPAPVIQVPSPIRVSIDNMQRASDVDDVVLYTTANGGALSPRVANIPALGADRLTNATFDWTGQPVLRGDGLWVVHVASRSHWVQHVSARWAADAVYLPALDQTEGTPLVATGTFAPGVRRSASMIADVSAIRRDSLDHGLGFVSGTIRAAPDRGRGTLAGAAVLEASYNVDPANPVTTHVLDYADPFPPSWSRISQVDYFSLRRVVRLPGGTFGALISDHVSAIKPGAVLPALTGPATARVPRNLRFAGAPTTDTVHHPDGRPLVLAWDPVDGATYYAAFATTLTLAGRPTLISALTTATELVLPADVVPDQTRVTFRVTAITGGELGAAPNRAAAERTTGSVSSDVVLFSSSCGNGIVDGGEECDTAGSSMSCNFDCTAPRCGDGVFNRAAGEECDDGEFFVTATCDECRAVACGDRKVSPSEQCDDGNATAGDGCDAQCRIELTRCGNGANDPGEECDDGNTEDRDACSNTCKYAVCGDAIRAGDESCDDGNNTTGDGCSSGCQIERCGDGLVILPEQCDDGNTSNGDACSAGCQLTP